MVAASLCSAQEDHRWDPPRKPARNAAAAVQRFVKSSSVPAPGWPDKPTRILIATRDVHDPESEDDQVTPVVRRAFSFMGIRDVASLLAGGSLGVNRGEVRLEDHVARFEQAIAALAA